MYESVIKGPQGDIVKAFGLLQFDELLKLNPDINEGILTSLRGLSIEFHGQISNKNMPEIDLTNVSATGGIFINCIFDANQFNTQLSSQPAFMCSCTINNGAIDSEKKKINNY